MHIHTIWSEALSHTYHGYTYSHDYAKAFVTVTNITLTYIWEQRTYVGTYYSIPNCYNTQGCSTFCTLYMDPYIPVVYIHRHCIGPVTVYTLHVSDIPYMRKQFTYQYNTDTVHRTATILFPHTSHMSYNDSTNPGLLSITFQ